MGKILALALKDLRLLLRDKAGFFFVFFFPLVYCMFFGAIFANSSASSETNAMKVAVVDEDGTEGSQSFIETLDAAPEIEVEITDRETARSLVRRGERIAYVILPEGFGQSIDRPFWGGGETPKLQTGIDPSRRAEAGMLQGILTQYMYRNIQKVMTDREKMKGFIAESLAEVQAAEDVDPVTRGALMLFLPALDGFMDSLPNDSEGFAGFAQAQIKQEDVSRDKRKQVSSYQVSFPQGMVWGLIGCAAAFGISFVQERTNGTLVRLRMAPIARVQILAGKAAACFATTLALQIVLLGVGWKAFGVIPNSVPLLLMALVCASCAFVGLMMFLSVLGKTEQSAGGIGWAILLVMAMTGGGMIPLAMMPRWMETISHASPIKWTILAVEGAIWRDFSFSEMLFPCGILLGVGILCFAIGVRAFRWTQES